MVTNTERAKILEMIEDGTITAEDGLSLLKALDNSDQDEIFIHDDIDVGSGEEFGINDPEEGVEIDASSLQSNNNLPEEVELINDFSNGEFVDKPDASTKPDYEEMQKWKKWWVIPLWIGAGITVVGGLLMYWAFQSSGLGFWFVVAWLPFLLGVALLAFAWNSRTSPWIHVRIHQAKGNNPKKIAISFPIPIRLTVWGFRLFGNRIPHMEGTSLDEVIFALQDVARDGTPLFVDVDDNEDGERVQVFIG